LTYFSLYATLCQKFARTWDVLIEIGEEDNDMRKTIPVISTIRLVAVLCLVLASAGADSGPQHQTSQVRPIALGTSGGNIEDHSTLYCCSGTLGALVQDGAGILHILSNNHVLARANHGIVGEDVSQPGMIDQNCNQNGIVADLSGFVPLQFRQGRNRPANYVDAAVAEVRPGQVLTDGSILDIGVPSANTVAASVGQSVQKSGRTTGHTTGTVSEIDVSVDVGYSNDCGGASNNVARFVNQIRITSGSFSAGGDSGSLILESGTSDPANGRPRPVGLLFAGSTSSTIANPIDAVLSGLGVSIVGATTGTPGPTGSLSGIVTDASTGIGIAGAAVQVDTGQSATTDSTGAYSIDSVATGDHTLTASALGYEIQQASATVGDGTNTVVDFSLTPATAATMSRVRCVEYNTSGGKNQDKNLLITVRAEDDLGALLANASVSISVTLNSQPFGSGTATTGSNGEVSFIVRNASSGAYSTEVTDIASPGLSFQTGSTPPNTFVKGTDSVPAQFCNDSISSSSDTATGSPGKPAALQTARNVNARHSESLFSIPGVVGHGVGLNKNGKPSIHVFLESENAKPNVPTSLDNVPVRVVVTGPFTAY
jgi:hypothetical protein